MARIAEGLFLLEGRVDGVDEGAQAVGVEGLEGADAGELDELGLGEGGHDDFLAVGDVAGGAGVFLQDVDGREAGLVFVGPFADGGEAADEAFEALDVVELGLEVAEDEVVAAGGDADVGEGGEAFVLGELVEFEGVFVEEADVDDVLAGLEDGLDVVEAHEAGDGADDEVGVFDGGFYGDGLGEVGFLLGDAFGGEAGEVGFGCVDGGDLEVGVSGEVFDHGAADAAGAEDGYAMHGASF